MCISSRCADWPGPGAVHLHCQSGEWIDMSQTAFVAVVGVGTARHCEEVKTSFAWSWVDALI